MNSPNQQFKQLERHSEYYIPGGDLHLLADNTLFRVHSYFFLRESPKFRDQLTQPVSPGSPRQGTEDSNAIVLSDVAAKDFASLLSVFYNSQYSLYNLGIPEWSTILRLSDLWLFHEVKNLAIRELKHHRLPLVDRVALYQKFNVDEETLVPLYAALCLRQEQIEVDEGHLLGMQTSLRVYQTREIVRALPESERKGKVVAAVREIFGVVTPENSDENKTAADKKLPPLVTKNGNGKQNNATADNKTGSSQKPANGKANGS